MKAPFPWFGGKSKAAPLIWSRLGADCGNYAEPFFGSGAVWFNRPPAFRGWATVNDLDGNLANVWRSMQRNPEAVAEAACWPINECDLHARHLQLVTNLPCLAERLMADPDYCDPVMACWWIWGACAWIGSGWCDGSGPWSAVPDAEGVPTLTRNGGKGVNRQLPHLGNGGRGGVNRQLQGDRIAWLMEWFANLSASLEGVRVACGVWQRICSVRTMTRNGTCAVVLDPPYSQTEAVYAHDSSTVAHDAREWALANGDNRKLRIALCGHDGEHNALEAAGWTVEIWAKGGGYQGTDDRERIWFSPHCLGREDDLFSTPRLPTGAECD